ncbi:MAG TPA: GGDEF domain-containing protein [Lachnospiraceae bacterium]|nr:GGDEF domain-containing protein [Lachnospiraceae bacterium]
MIKKRMNAKIQQNIGFIALLISFFIAALIIRTVKKDLLIEAIIMVAASFSIVLLTLFKRVHLSIVFACVQTVLYMGYWLGKIGINGVQLTWINYIWMVFPTIIAIISYMFVLGNKRVEMELDVLKEKGEELMMISKVTGLYNVKILYNDIRMQKAYAERNNLALSLMIIKVQFKTEWKKLFPMEQYHEIMKEIGIIITDAVRIEDRTYSIDDESTFGVLLICDKEGSSFVSNRIERKLREKDILTDFLKEKIEVTVKIACKEYKKEDYGEDVILFKQLVENELF